MSDEKEVPEAESVSGALAVPEPDMDMHTDPEWAPASTIESRFLFVGVASQRAKQLRRGSLPRLQALAPDPETGIRPEPQQKLERIAMEEVGAGLIVHELPGEKPAAKETS